MLESDRRKVASLQQNVIQLYQSADRTVNLFSTGVNLHRRIDGYDRQIEALERKIKDQSMALRRNRGMQNRLLRRLKAVREETVRAELLEEIDDHLAAQTFK